MLKPIAPFLLLVAAACANSPTTQVPPQSAPVCGASSSSGPGSSVASSYAMAEAKILKVYTQDDDAYHFIAYAIPWQGHEVIVTDALGRSDLKAGDSVKFMASKFHSQTRQSTTNALSFAISLGQYPKPAPKTVQPANTKGGMEKAEAKILKVYAYAQEPHRFVAYVVEWKGREIVVSDTLAKSDFKAGDMLPFGVHKFSSSTGPAADHMLSFGVRLAPKLNP